VVTRRPDDRVHLRSRRVSGSVSREPDGSGLERLTDNPAYDDQAAFSPDGKQLVLGLDARGRTAEFVDLDIATPSDKGADIRRGRRLPAIVVA
jgi:hypothetical protein